LGRASSIFCRTSLPSLCYFEAVSKSSRTCRCLAWRPRAAISSGSHHQVVSYEWQDCVITRVSQVSGLRLFFTISSPCRIPAQLEQVSTPLTTALYTLAESGAIDPAVVTDTVSAKNGGFFGPLASLFETFLKVRWLCTQKPASPGCPVV